MDVGVSHAIFKGNGVRTNVFNENVSLQKFGIFDKSTRLS